jgi:GNAT superfamily N-acetyltransferase
VNSQKVALIGVPSSVRSQLPVGTTTRGAADIVLTYVRTKEELAERFDRLMQRMLPDGEIWIAWPRDSDMSLREAREVAFGEVLSDYGKRELGPGLSCRAFRRSRERRPNRPAARVESEVEVVPLTPDRWDDFAALMGLTGPTKWCWCMAYRLSHSEFVAGYGEGNRAAIRAIVVGGAVPGLLAYVDGKPAGWCSVAPRRQYSGSRAIVSAADEHEWLVACFFVPTKHRLRGVSSALLRGAVSYVRSQGGRSLIGLPATQRGGRSVKDHRGSASVFERQGFREVSRPSAGAAVMRLDLLGADSQEVSR